MSQDQTVQFVTSPYADIFVQVLLKGKSTTRIHKRVVPANVLSSRSTQELAPKSATPTLDMQDLGNDTAHVVIHFFYTKQYDCIKPTGVSSDSAKGYELKVSLQVIEAAKKMELPALVDLAKRKCARLCKELDLLNLVAILGKLSFDYTSFPDIQHHIAYHLEKVLANPRSQFATELLSRATTNSITNMLVRKLVMMARKEQKSEAEVKPRPEDEVPGVLICESRPHPPFQDSVIAKPELSQLSQERRTKQFQKTLKKLQSDDKGKGRDDSEPAERDLKVPLPTASHHDSCLAKGQEEADSGSSRLREGPSPFSNPSSGLGTVPNARKKLNAPQRGGSLSKPAEVVSTIHPSWTRIMDERLKVVEAKMEAKRSESTHIDSESGGVIVSSEPHPTTMPSPSSYTGLENSIAKMKDFVVAETTSAVDWELPKFVAEKLEKPEGERQESTLEDSDSEGVLVEADPQPIMTPSPTASDNSAMRRFLAFDRILAVRLDKKHIFSKPLDTVDIEDYPFLVGHIIIHYLVTDKYQCLNPEWKTEDERNCSELATAFRAHAAVVDLEFPILQLLASSEMRRLEGKLSLVSITRTLNDIGLPLDLYPTITANFVAYAIRLSAPPSQKCKDGMMNQLGVPENVAMVLVK
ncbi:hypothetical protein FOVSG1_005314 [Fusarium oxysporum f. sp. vasinfectum]